MSGGDPRPIGVFDSGMGGLTVLKALRAHLPAEDLIYLGDTARLPYGTKSAETVTSYALQATKLLIAANVKMVVIACNTASSVALGPLAKALAPVPVVGVVEPGARAGAAATRSGHIAVIATEGTVRGGAYVRAIQAIRPDARVTQCACPLFVALAEEGWIDGPVTEGAARRYLDPIFSMRDAPDTLVLGCTHFPVLRPMLAAMLGSAVSLVDSAETTAQAVSEILNAHGLAKPRGVGRQRFFATDAPDRFARLGGIFFDAPIAVRDVELVDL